MKPIRKISVYDAILYVPRKHISMLREQIELIVQEDEQNNGTEWRKIAESIVLLTSRGNLRRLIE